MVILWYNISMPNNTQPTILVKKSDGTFARMSLDEIKKMKEVKTAPGAPAIPPTKYEGIQTPATVKPTEIPASVGMTNKKFAPVIKPVLSDSSVATLPQNDNKQRSKMTTNDAKSLLEEDIPTTKGTATAVRRDNQVDAVIKKLTFLIPPAYDNRLRSAVQLRLKEVRGEKETRATVLRSIKDGGLGLTENQADEIEKACVAVGNLGARDWRKTKNIGLAKEGEILPEAFHTPPVPAKSAPFNAFVHEKFLRKNALEKMPEPRDSAVASFLQSDIKKEEKFKISPVSVSRPAMKDVVAKSAPVGPIEEIKLFTLTDFRRLAQDPAQASKRLAQKFLNLKEESVLLFWQAIDAWRQSSLFSDYVGVLNRAFSGQPSASGNEAGISSHEIEALIQMEKDLGI